MKFRIALFFTLLFSVIIITPTVITLIDDTCDVAFFIDLNEEEEKNGKEAPKDLEIKIYPSENFSLMVINQLQKKKNVSFNSKNYTSQYPKVTTPPPQFLL